MGQNRVMRLPQVERGTDAPGANGGRTWDRTTDLLRVKQALIPLSYAPLPTK